MEWTTFWVLVIQVSISSVVLLIVLGLFLEIIKDYREKSPNNFDDDENFDDIKHVDSERLEELASEVHDTYIQTCRRLGWAIKDENNVPYGELSEDSKELDRASVRVVLRNLRMR